MLNNFIKEKGDLFSTQPQIRPADIYQAATLYFLRWQRIPCVHTALRHTTKVSQPRINFHMFF